MFQLWICYYTLASAAKPLSCANVATGVAWINWSFWVEERKEQYPLLADLADRMETESPFEPIVAELRALLSASAGSAMPAELKTVTRALLIGVMDRPDDTTSVVITDGKEDRDDKWHDGEDDKAA